MLRRVGNAGSSREGVKINKDSYLATVKNYYEPDMRILLPQGAVFMQDGASSHTAKVVKAHLASRDYRSLSPWPANSPDLNPLDYGIWGMLQADVERAKPQTDVDLLAAIRRACASLPLGVVRKTVDDFPRLHVCARADGMRVFHFARAQALRGGSVCA